MCRQNLVSDHHKVITSFFVMVIVLLSLVTYSQSASSTVTYGNKSTDTRMNYSPFRLPFGTGFTSIATAAADTCRKLPITNATKANLIDLTKPAAPTSIPVFTCTSKSSISSKSDSWISSNKPDKGENGFRRNGIV